MKWKKSCGKKLYTWVVPHNPKMSPHKLAKQIKSIDNEEFRWQTQSSGVETCFVWRSQFKNHCNYKWLASLLNALKNSNLKTISNIHDVMQKFWLQKMQTVLWTYFSILYHFKNHIVSKSHTETLLPRNFWLSTLPSNVNHENDGIYDGLNIENNIHQSVCMVFFGICHV